MLVNFDILFLRGPRLADLRQLLQMMRLTVRLVRQLRIDLIYVNNGPPMQWAGAAAWWCSVPVLVHIHAPWSRKMRLLLGLHHADRVVCVSRAVLRRFAVDPALRGRLDLLYNGIGELDAQPSGRDAARSALGIGPGDVVIGVAAVLVAGKRVDLLIEAIRLLPEDIIARTKLLVIGDGPERARLEKEAVGLPVLFAGQRDDVHRLMLDVLDILALASDLEAFSIALLEGAKAALPRVGVDRGGIPESIMHGIDGLIVPPDNPSALSAALSSLIRDPAARQRFGIAGQLRISRDFTLDRQIAGFTAVCDSLTSSSPPNRLHKLGRALRSIWYQTIPRRWVAGPSAAMTRESAVSRLGIAPPA